jgi:hypothetical protein
LIDETLRSFELTLDHLRRLIADVSDEEMTRQPHGAVNHPAWVIGHLAYSCQAIGGELGITAWLPAEWQQTFGTGSTPVEDRSVYPSKHELLAMLDDGQRRIADRIQLIGEAGMCAPLPDRRHRDKFPTVGHAVVHILTAHSAVHVGQISCWRRIAGYGPLTSEFI